MGNKEMEYLLSREGYQGEESAGFLSGEIFEVTKATFATDARYPGLQLHWLGRTTGESGADFDDMTEFHPSWSVGKDWESIDGGKTATHPQGKTQFRAGRNRHIEMRNVSGDVVIEGGKPVVVNPGAYIQELITIAMGLVPEGGPDDIFSTDSSPLDASIWVGTSWRIDDLAFDFGGTGENAIGVKTKLMPTEYLGRVGAGAPPVKEAVPAAPAAASNGVVRAKVTALAKKAADFSEFQSEALGVDGVLADDALLAEIIDEANGIWASR